MAFVNKNNVSVPEGPGVELISSQFLLVAYATRVVVAAAVMSGGSEMLASALRVQYAAAILAANLSLASRVRSPRKEQWGSLRI